MYRFIPIAPRLNVSQNSRPFEDVDWTAEQVDFTVNMVIDKILGGGEHNLKIKKDEYQSDSFSITDGNRIYLSISDSGYVFMILDNKASGSYNLGGWYWQDRQLKKSVKKLRNICRNITDMKRQLLLLESNKYKSDLAMRSLFNAFPEAITQEFEKHVLESKNGKS